MLKYIIAITLFIFIATLIAERSHERGKKESLERYFKAKEEAGLTRNKEVDGAKAGKSASIPKNSESKKLSDNKKEESTVISSLKNIFTNPLKISSKTSKYNEPDYKYFMTADVKEDKASKVGRQGEYETFKQLKRIKEFNIVYANVYVPTRGNKTSEVDLIMITEYGVFVIESKNYGGWIFGKDSDRKWTVMYNKHDKFQFYNPIMQNDSHITAVSSYLDLPTDVFKSYVVFGGKSELKDITLSRNDVEVIKSFKIRRYINKVLNNSEKIFTINQVEKIAEKLEKHTRVSDEVKNAHIKNAKQAKERFKRK